MTANKLLDQIYEAIKLYTTYVGKLPEVIRLSREAWETLSAVYKTKEIHTMCGITLTVEQDNEGYPFLVVGERLRYEDDPLDP